MAAGLAEGKNEMASVSTSAKASGMPAAGTVWFLIGPLDSAEPTRYVPVHTLPFVIGRRPDLIMPIPCNTVSGLHAEITEADGSLVLRDLGSTNGTYVNGQRIAQPVALGEDDIVQFANVAFRVRLQSAGGNTHTVQENFCDRALALVQFDKLMTERAVTPFFQPIVSLPAREVLSYEVLARSRLFGLETPQAMFSTAAQLNMEVELSVMLRWEGVVASQVLPGPPHLFMNTHPRELAEPGLAESLRKLREHHPSQSLTLEIHEAAVTDASRMDELRPVLRELNMGLAYDDFGTGQSRVNELAHNPPDCLKFDMSLVRGIDSASPQRQQVLASLVQMARGLGIVTLAEGIETQAESETCQQMGFELGQGYFYGRPAPARHFHVPG
jgi:EAL domain-containing protein (putative c-di-GMP-specific phosphodiesterase class I)